MGYEQEADLYQLFHCTGKKIQESTPKIQMLMFGLVQTSYFGLWDIIPPPPPPPRVQTSISHILCKI